MALQASYTLDLSAANGKSGIFYADSAENGSPVHFFAGTAAELEALLGEDKYPAQAQDLNIFAQITYAGGTYTLSDGSTAAGAINNSVDKSDIVAALNGSNLNKKLAISAAVAAKFTLAAGVSYTGTDYNDSIAPATGATVISGTGKDTIDVSASAQATDVYKFGANGYTYESDVIVVAGNAALTVAEAVALVDNDGNLSAGGAGAKGSVELNPTSGYYKAHVSLTGAANDYYVWHGGTTAATMDGSAETNGLIMIAGASSDTLVGGSKADSVVATSEGAYAFGGAGSDTVILGNAGGIAMDGVIDAARQYAAMSTESGKDTIYSFNANFGEAGDVLVLRDGSVEDVTIKSVTGDANGDGGAEIKLGSGVVSLNGDGAGYGAAGAELIIRDQSGKDNKVAAVVEGENFVVADTDHLADYYIGTGKAAVSFAAIADDLVVDLGNAGAYEDNATFKNIVSVTGGTGNTTLVGGAETVDSLVGTGGNTTLWGGGSANDVLQGGTAAGAVNAYFVSAYDGKDTIQNFQLGVEADAADTLYMLGKGASAVSNDGTNTTLTFEDGSSATLAGKSGGNGLATSAIRFSTDGAKVQTALIGLSNDTTTFHYTSDVDMYFGGSKSDTLSIDAGYDASSIDIRLNNTGAQGFSSVDAVNASAYTEKAFLSGSDENSELIIGGQGKTTLWGGLGAVSDTLRGTSGDVTEFYFGKNNGSDIITASDSDDKVVFYDFANTDLTAIDTSGTQLKFTFNDGSSLQVTNHTSASVQEFQFTNSSWTYDKSTRAFTQVK